MIVQMNLNVQSFQTSLNHGRAPKQQQYFILKGNGEAPPQLVVGWNLSITCWIVSINIGPCKITIYPSTVIAQLGGANSNNLRKYW